MRVRTPKALLALALVAGSVVLGSSPASAAPPANDDFGAAVAFTALPFSAETDTTEATNAPDDPVCTGGDENTVWYAVTLDSTTEIVVDTSGSDYDTTLSAWNGTRGSLTQVACNDDGTTRQSRIQFVARAGVTYHLMAASFLQNPGSHLVLHGQMLPPAMRLGLTLDPNGSLTSSAAAVIHATVTCSRPGDLVVTGTLREQVGRRVTVGSFRTAVSCTGSSTWQATVVGETGRYARGTAAAVVAVQFVDQIGASTVTARVTGNIQLR